VLEDLLPLAEVKHIDIGVEGTEDIRVFIDEVDLLTVVKNLHVQLSFTDQVKSSGLCVSVRCKAAEV